MWICKTNINLFNQLTEKVEEQFEDEIKPAEPLSAISSILKPEANNAYSCQVHCLLEKNFTCGFAVFSVGEMRCFIGPGTTNSTNQFLQVDQAYLRKGEWKQLRFAAVVLGLTIIQASAIFIVLHTIIVELN